MIEEIKIPVCDSSRQLRSRTKYLTPKTINDYSASFEIDSEDDDPVAVSDEKTEMIRSNYHSQ